MANPINLLDAQTVRNAQPQADKDYPLRDGGGLFLLVRTTGSKLWRLKFGNTMRSLGAYPTISLAQARVKRDTIRQAAAGNAGMLAAPPPSPLFEKVARDWHAANQGRWSAHHAATLLRASESN